MTQYALYAAEITPLMTEERARRIKELRVSEKHTYVQVSALIHKEWGRDARWPKVGCKDAGEALCVAACRRLDEVPYKEPWA